eukprot:5043844-Amphidinium_carterae.1
MEAIPIEALETLPARHLPTHSAHAAALQISAKVSQKSRITRLWSLRPAGVPTRKSALPRLQ